MTLALSFHSPRGGMDFLGLRERRRGDVEIVYDDGVAKRLVWKVTGERTDTALLREALSSAVRQGRVLTALHAELRRRSIAVEIVG
jgi:hypothetical protein